MFKNLANQLIWKKSNQIQPKFSNSSIFSISSPFLGREMSTLNLLGLALKFWPKQANPSQIRCLVPHQGTKPRKLCKCCKIPSR